MHYSEQGCRLIFEMHSMSQLPFMKKLGFSISAFFVHLHGRTSVLVKEDLISYVWHLKHAVELTLIAPLGIGACCFLSLSPSCSVRQRQSSW